MKRKIVSIQIFLVCFFLFLDGCLIKSGGHSHPSGKNHEEKVYKLALKDFEDGKFSSAKSRLGNIVRANFFSEHSPEYRILYTQAAYEEGEFVEASGSANEYLVNYPKGKDVDTALFIQADSYLKMLSDPSNTTELVEDAISLLHRLINQFPDSKHVGRAKECLKIAEDIIAEKILVIAKFYMKKMSYHSVITRCEELIDKYPNSKFKGDALLLKQKAYDAMGLIYDTSGAVYHKGVKKDNVVATMREPAELVSNIEGSESNKEKKQ